MQVLFDPRSRRTDSTQAESRCLMRIAANALMDLVGEAEMSRAMRGPEVMIAAEKLAGEVVAYAQSIAPVFGDKAPHRNAPPHGAPEDYKNSIHALAPRIDGDSVIIPIRSDDYKAWWIEYGSRHMPEYAVFSRTAEHFGGTGPDMASEQVATAQGILRHALEDLAHARALPGHTTAQGMDKAAAISKARQRVESARNSRSAAGRAAARNSRGRGGRGRRR